MHGLLTTAVKYTFTIYSTPIDTTTTTILVQNFKGQGFCKCHKFSIYVILILKTTGFVNNYVRQKQIFTFIACTLFMKQKQ